MKLQKTKKSKHILLFFFGIKKHTFCILSFWATIIFSLMHTVKHLADITIFKSTPKTMCFKPQIAAQLI